MIGHAMTSPRVFVNRTEELNRFAYDLETLRLGEPVLEPVLLFHGVPQVGKTTLLREAERRAAARGIPTAFIDLERSRDRYQGEKGRIQLANDIMAGLVVSADSPAPTSIVPSKDSTEIAAAKLLDYIEWLQRFLKKPIVLFFDTVDEGDPENFVWLQEKIFAPLLDQAQALIVIAGWLDYRSSQLNFLFPIKRRTEMHPLEPFDEKETREQMRALGIDIPNEPNLVEITGGLPGLNRQVLTELNRTSSEQATQAIEHIWERKPISEEHRTVLLALSVFRQFDTRLLERTVSKLWQPIGKEVDRRQARELLKNLRLTTLVQQHPDGYGFVVPRGIRRVFDTYEQLTNRKQHYELHLLAVNFFRDEVEKRGDVVFIADELYHLGGLWHDAEEGQWEVPNDINPEDKSLSDLLQERLGSALEQMRENPRRDEFLLKIKSVLAEPDFGWYLKETEVDKLKTLSDPF